ncbi:hypothetical protein L226DRAFT_455201 [Lentinus tigrinus ALCF2SS1-7]|uniref:GDS1 winged helix domain-containing protein n=1 Tax=Lentinus tigrinus ALCF2SS1-6 TaxID=1328759 RepID=A0A5C2SQ33_9APHY|nr:hypothetical protein L227DRAFT_517300 [Lentinus tigrinus ALCF2SS1-6]RPD79901.1 hypothetical protein L226DRAFT_455201 [Lentinus tigrinus ALCF2SS1-7]
MFTPILPAPTPHPSAQHQYETRIRSHSAIKPSIRLRQSPDAPPAPARRVKGLPSTKSKHVVGYSTAAPAPAWPPFPPPHVVLHPEDASSKVFLAIGRSFMSVDNRAMTIKDLSELCMKYGLMCQNVSAAGQAITTFIRNHLARCDAQQDQSLLLKQTMSGTISDDDLVPALYSRIGGAHCTLPEDENRLTNFRRGTAVWYLSKAAGLPCPFARSGIRLCDYNENGKVGMPINPGRERRRERDRQRNAARADEGVGQKRKRLLRSCADKLPGSVSDSSDEEEKRPPKVKLMLRLKPSMASCPNASTSGSVTSYSRAGSSHSQDLDHVDDHNDEDSDESDSDSMSVDSDSDDSPLSEPSSPLRPSTTAVVPNSSLSDLPPPSLDFTPHSVLSRRSPSVPYSVFSGSPPPESDEEDDFHIDMSSRRRLSPGRLRTPLDDDDSAWEDDFFGDVDADTETQWESPGPRSPSVQIDDVVVKQEPTDVRGLLDAWDDIESRATDMKVIDVVAQAAALEREAEQSATDDFSSWSWPPMELGGAAHIKQEEEETKSFFLEHDPTPPPEALSPIVPFDPCESPVEECPLNLSKPGLSFELQWRDVEILGPDSVKPCDLEDSVWHEYRGARAVSPEERIQSPSPEPSTAAAASPLSSPKLSRSALAPLDLHATTMGTSPGTSPVPERHPSITSPSLIASLTSLYIQTPASIVPPALSQSAAPQPVMGMSPSPSMEPLVVPTILPSDPAICATLFEGVPVYQMIVGSSTFLRRIDTDFVNVSSISLHLKTSCPSAPNAVTITAGSPPVCGTWLPASEARNVAKDEPMFGAFLSDGLRTLFPKAINALTPPDGRETAFTAFGHQFRSASDARRQSMASHRLELPPREFETSWEDHLSTHPPFILATSSIDGHRPTEEIPPVVETPLSPTEEEMFRVLCAASDWEPTMPAAEGPVEENAEDAAAASARPATEAPDCAHEPPLRRSKRVANAVATRSRTRSSRRGSRTSLS